MLAVPQALEILKQSVVPVEGITSELLAALGSRLAEDIPSPADSPPFDKSMMDGYAVRAADCRAENITLSVVAAVMAGQTSQHTLKAGQAIQIMTGAPVPEGANAVVPVEWTRREGDHVAAQLNRPIRAGLNIVSQGLAMRQGEVVLRAGTRIRAQEIALLAEMGCARVPVRPTPEFAVLATGDELVPIDQVPGLGQIRNSNAIMLAAQMREWGAGARVLDIARDSEADLDQQIAQGLQSNFLCLSGGVSAGERDLVPAALKRAGVREVFHKVLMKPGKPIWFGIAEPAAGRTCYVFGLPGNPVSSMVCAELFVRYAMECFSGNDAESRMVAARLSQEVVTRGDRPVYHPARLELGSTGLEVAPVDWKGSFDLRSTTDANCSLVLPSGEATLAVDSEVEVLPWGRLAESLPAL